MTEVEYRAQYTYQRPASGKSDSELGAYEPRLMCLGCVGWRKHHVVDGSANARYRCVVCATERQYG